MLFNPKWEKPESNPLTLSSLVAWLEKKDPTEKYQYSSCGHCLVALVNGFKTIHFEALS